MYSTYSDSETCKAVLFRMVSDSLLSDGSSTRLFRSLTISMADLKGKIKTGSRGFNCGINCNSDGI